MTRPCTASTTSVTTPRSCTSSPRTSATALVASSAGAIAIAMSFCGLSSVASAGRMLYAFSRDDGMPGIRLAQEGLASLPDAGQLRSSPWSSARSCWPVAAFLAGGGTAIVIVTAISTIFLYAAYGIVHLPRRDDDRSGWSTESWSLGPLLQADRLDRRRLGHRPDGPVQLPDLGQHLHLVHDRGVLLLLAHLLLRVRAGATSRVRGSHGRQRRADRDRTRVRRRRRRGRRRPSPTSTDATPHANEGRPRRPSSIHSRHREVRSR